MVAGDHLHADARRSGSDGRRHRLGARRVDHALERRERSGHRRRARARAARDRTPRGAGQKPARAAPCAAIRSTASMRLRFVERDELAVVIECGRAALDAAARRRLSCRSTARPPPPCSVAMNWCSDSNGIASSRGCATLNSASSSPAFSSHDDERRLGRIALDAPAACPCARAANRCRAGRRRGTRPARDASARLAGRPPSKMQSRRAARNRRR